MPFTVNKRHKLILVNSNRNKYNCLFMHILTSNLDENREMANNAKTKGMERGWGGGETSEKRLEWNGYSSRFFVVLQQPACACVLVSRRSRSLGELGRGSILSLLVYRDVWRVCGEGGRGGEFCLANSTFPHRPPNFFQFSAAKFRLWIVLAKTYHHQGFPKDPAESAARAQ